MGAAAGLTLIVQAGVMKIRCSWECLGAAAALAWSQPRAPGRWRSSARPIAALIAAVREAGADEALMLDVHGFVNTTNACNFFIVRKGAVWTSTGDYCMNGVTRGKVIEVCRANGIPVFEKNYSLYEAYGAQEAFLTGTFGAQTPVASIDGKAIGNGIAGPVTRRIRALYEELVRAETAG